MLDITLILITIAIGLLTLCVAYLYSKIYSISIEVEWLRRDW